MKTILEMIKRKGDISAPDLKYEFTGETVILYGRVLRRIRALKTFKSRGSTIRRGDLGGLIEFDDNLSQEGTCWLEFGAKAFGNARVYEDAFVGEGVEVFGDAQVHGKAQVVCDYLSNISICCDANISGTTYVNHSLGKGNRRL